MKILEITVRYAIRNDEEQAQVLSFLSKTENVEVKTSNKAVKLDAPAEYVPSCERTRLAVEALGRCKRVAVLRPEVLETWANAYPNIDLASEIAKCEAWAQSTTKTRTARGWQKTLNFWLSREQDKAKTGPNIVVTAKPAMVIAPEAETKAWLEAAA